MSRNTVVFCDAPDCEREQVVGDFDGGEPERWFMATVRVERPEDHEPDCEHDPGWHFEPYTDTVDACCLEHLRSAMVAVVAELTDEPAVP